MERLIKIQQGLRIPKDKEGDKGRFKFRSAEDIFEKVKPLLAETGTAVVVSDELVEVGGRCAIKATASLMCNSGNGVLATATGWACLDSHISIDRNTGKEKRSMSNEQCTGSASSYARKFALCGLFAIDNDEADPDQPTIQPADPKPSHQPEQQQVEEEPELTEKEKSEMDALFADIDATENMDQLKACVTLANGQRYEKKVRAKANKRAKQEGWC